ncbi:MAG: hypothetical protein CM15mV94_050 [uncultured marine virus]|nr:MAG: hypothetical protein CM15mV94_050 [uncultured marine virus]
MKVVNPLGCCVYSSPRISYPSAEVAEPTSLSKTVSPSEVRLVVPKDNLS